MCEHLTHPDAPLLQLKSKVFSWSHFSLGSRGHCRSTGQSGSGDLTSFTVMVLLLRASLYSGGVGARLGRRAGEWVGGKWYGKTGVNAKMCAQHN